MPYAPDRALARVRHADEGIAPASGRALAVPVRGSGWVELAAMVGAAFARARHPGLDRMIGGFERQDHDSGFPVARAGVVGLLRVEDAAVRRKKPGLDKRRLSQTRHAVEERKGVAPDQPQQIFDLVPAAREESAVAFGEGREPNPGMLRVRPFA